MSVPTIDFVQIVEDAPRYFPLVKDGYKFRAMLANKRNEREARREANKRARKQRRGKR